MSFSVKQSRLKKELEMLSKRPPPGICCWMLDDNLEKLEATIIGSKDTPYEDGIFKLEIYTSDRYPFEPPKVKFLTPIYHPNIDSGGRICLDVLKMPPQGGWKPSLNISSILISIQLLMAEPNPDDPLMAEIAKEFKYDQLNFIQNAKKWTQQHALNQKSSNNQMLEQKAERKEEMNKENETKTRSDHRNKLRLNTQ